MEKPQIVLYLIIVIVLGILTFVIVDTKRQNDSRTNWYSENGYVLVSDNKLGDVRVKIDDVIKLKLDAATSRPNWYAEHGYVEMNTKSFGVIRVRIDDVPKIKAASN